MTNYTTPTLLVGIDIGKNVNEIGVYYPGELEAERRSVTVHHNRDGLDTTIRIIDELLAAGHVLKMGNEPTGIYYENWTRELRDHYQAAMAARQLSYELIPPKLVKDAREGLQRGRKRKTDRIDTQAIAQCLQLNQGIPIRLPQVAQVAFEQWTQRYRSLERAKRDLQINVMTQVDRLWPGAFVNVNRFKKTHPTLTPPVPLVQTRPLERRLVQVLLSHYPNPYDVLCFSESELHQALQCHMRTGIKTTRKVLRNVRQAVLPPRPIADVYAQRLGEDWTRLQLLYQQLERLDIEAETLVLDSPAAVLVSIPGVTAASATRYLAAIQDVHQFAHADHIWAFAGFDPVITASGDHQQMGKISRKGDPFFRDTLFRIGQSTARHAPPIRAAFLRRYDKRSKNHVLATLHAAHKANRLLYRLLLSQQPYQPKRHR